MARLSVGENPKIDRINELVKQSQDKGNQLQASDAIGELLNIFHPMILKICKTWSDYFQDYSHRIKPFDMIVTDAQSWFYEYTVNKYIIDGRATYNKFIKDHLTQRIRYIYECELKYLSHHIFPDPDKTCEDNNDTDMLENVIHEYAHINRINVDSMDDMLIQDMRNAKRHELSLAIMKTIKDRRYFNEREEQIFNECIVNGVTHEEMGVRLRISRTRVSQLVNKIRIKMRNIMLQSDEVDAWEVIDNINKII